MEFFDDPRVWTAVAFFILVALAFKPLKNMIIKALDNRSLAIKKELDEALRLKEEAELLLVSCQRRYKEVLEEAEQIMAHAESESRRMTDEALVTLENAVNKRIALSHQKIATYEAAILQEVRNNAIHQAINSVQTSLGKELDAKTSNMLIDEAISDIGRKLH